MSVLERCPSYGKSVLRGFDCSDKGLKFYTVMDNDKVFSKIGKKCYLCINDVLIVQTLKDFKAKSAKAHTKVSFEPLATKSGVLIMQTLKDFKVKSAKIHTKGFFEPLATKS